MYTDFFHFKEKPFALEPSARFIMLGKDHREALATMVYAIDEQEGYALLLGQPGVGKTTLIIALLKELGDRVIPAVVTNPRVAALDFMNMMALELGLPGPYQTKGQFLVALTDLIKRSRREGKVVLLVIDEAHSLPPDMVEELRLLGNLDDSTPRVLNIFLVGQPELVKLLKSSNAVSLLQRLRRYHVLRPLSQEETKAYVRHRLRVAGGDPGTFDDQALEGVYRLSRGIPRLINSVCDDALLLAFTREQLKVDLALVMAGAKDDPTLRWTFGEPDALGLSQPQPAAANPLATPAAPAAAYAAPATTWTPPPAPPIAPAVPPPARPPAPAAARYQAPPPPAMTQAKPSRAERRAQAYAEKARRKAEKSKPKPRKAAPPPSAAAAPISPGAPRPPKKGNLWKKLVALVLAVAVIWGIYVFYKTVGKKIAVRLGLLKPAILMPAEISPALTRKPAKAQEQGPPDWGPLLRAKTGPTPAAGGNHG